MLLLLNFIGITEKSEGGNNERIVEARDTIRHWPRCVLAHSDTTTLEQECFAVGCLPTVAVPDTRCQNRGVCLLAGSVCVLAGSALHTTPPGWTTPHGVTRTDHGTRDRNWHHTPPPPVNRMIGLWMWGACEKFPSLAVGKNVTYVGDALAVYLNPFYSWQCRDP